MILFTKHDTVKDQMQVYLLKIEDYPTQPELLLEGKEPYRQFYVSPNKKKVLFTTRSSIYIFDKENKKIKKIKNIENPQSVVGWYSNDEVLLIKHDFKKIQKMHSININSQEVHRIAENLNVEDCPWFWGVNYSPDGKKIIFFMVDPSCLLQASALDQKEPRGWAIYISESDGSARKMVASRSFFFMRAHISHYSPTPFVVPHLAWSPQGDRIIFNACYDLVKGGGIYIIHRDGTNLQRLVDIGDANPELSWAPDGKRFVYNLNDILWVQNIDTNKKLNISHNHKELRWFRNIIWSPTGEEIAFLANDSLTQKTGLYIISSDGQEIEKIGDDLESKLIKSWFCWLLE